MIKQTKRLISVLLSVIMIFCMLPASTLNVYAWDIYVECEFCGEGAGDDWICSGGDHCGPDSGRDCWEENHCQICHECANNTEFCEDCKMCVECARDNKVHCLGCGECGMDTDLCPNCGQCYDSCGGMCSEGTDHLCYDCHLEEDADLICEDCGACFVDGASGRRCGICGGCMNCNGRCDSDEEHACLECHLEENMACPNCGDCYVDNEQETCPDCGSCYSCAEFICKDCGRCNDCVYDICDHCGEMCIDCHENEGGLCPDCGMCGGGDPVCDECGGCTWCYWICSVCGLCGECCWDYHCPECDACYLEVDRCLSGGEHCTLCCEENGWLCPECGECIEGNGYELVCSDCGACEGCSEFCDTCGDCCLDCLMNEESLHCPDCGICFYDTRNCHECGLCENCVELCEYCWDYCMDCAADLGFHCSGCGELCFSSGDPYCEGCELCADCVDEYCYDCERCVECAVDEEMHCPDCYRCFTADVYECEYGCGYCEYCCRCGYTVSFDANGGIGTMSDVKVYGAYVLPECGFISPNSIFSAWKVNGVNCSVGDTVIITEDTVIEAVWKRTVIPVTPYSISFSANGGSGTMDTVTVYGSKYVLPACQFKAPVNGRKTYAFAGWRVNDIQGTIPAGTPIDITGDTVLTAVWTETTFDTYTVFFDANGGTGIYGPIHRKTGSTYTLPKCYFTAPVGKQFKAWDVNGVEYAPGKTITISSNTAVKAIWDDIYVVLFDANGGSGTMDPYAMTKGTYTLPECSFEAPTGKQFKAWMVGIKEYAPGEKITVSAHTSVTALWKTAVSGETLSGTVTSFNDASGDITIQLIPAGFREAAYETVVKGNTVNYSIASVDAGTYTLKVMKSNHVTREYDVTVGTDPVQMDVKIHLKGDITGDGQINIMDVNRANLHFKKKITLTGYEFDCANITGDTQVNIMDVNRMNLHFKGKSKLW